MVTNSDITPAHSTLTAKPKYKRLLNYDRSKRSVRFCMSLSTSLCCSCITLRVVTRRRRRVHANRNMYGAANGATRINRGRMCTTACRHEQAKPSFCNRMFHPPFQESSGIANSFLSRERICGNALSDTATKAGVQGRVVGGKDDGLNAPLDTTPPYKRMGEGHRKAAGWNRGCMAQARGVRKEMRKRRKMKGGKGRKD